MTSLVDILRARVDRGSSAPHGDGARVALAVEGGAMRGVISAGMVSAIEELGYANAFDTVYGSSAGAINAAYLLGGQARVGTSIYFEDINNANFISFARAWRGRPIVNLGYLLHEVMERRKPLDVARVLSSATPLRVLATDIDARSSSTLDAFTGQTDLVSALRASATMPVVAGAPHVHHGRRYLDASLSEPIPVPTAELGGHTHVLALLTRAPGKRPEPSAFDRYFVGPRLRRLSPDLERLYLARATPYVELNQIMDRGTGPLGTAIVVTVRVADFPISKLERRRAILKAGAKRGYDAMALALA